MFSFPRINIYPDQPLFAILIYSLLLGITLGSLLASFWTSSGIRLSNYFYGSLRERKTSFWKLWSQPSSCASCGNKIPARHLIPFFSWFFLNGRCPYCRSRIDILYPAMEYGGIFYGALLSFLILNGSLQGSMLIWLIPASTLFVWIALIDAKKLHVPNSLLILLFLINLPLWLNQQFFSHTIPISEYSHWDQRGYGILFALIYFFIYLGFPRKLGFADVKFAFILGMVLTFQEMIIITLLSSLLGLISLLFRSRKNFQKMRQLRTPLISCQILALFIYFAGVHIYSILVALSM